MYYNAQCFKSRRRNTGQGMQKGLHRDAELGQLVARLAPHRQRGGSKIILGLYFMQKNI